MTEVSFEKSLNDLKQIYEIPKLHIANRLGDLRAEIDLAFAQSTNDCKVRNVWLKLIETVYNYEQDCCKSVEKNLNEKFSTIISAINTNEPDCNELIQDEMRKIEKVLFLNKTLFFFNKNTCENKSLLDQDNEFKLVIINDEFISREAIETFLKR